MAAVDRPVYTTRKHRAGDLVPGDVSRDVFGKWDTVISVEKVTGTGNYVTIRHEHGGTLTARAVSLEDVQTVKPS